MRRAMNPGVSCCMLIGGCMRRVAFLVSVLVLLSVMAGCKTSGITVQDNVYNSLGGMVVKVDDSFKYLGSVDPDVMVSSNNDRAKLDPSIITRGDVFVKSVDGVVSELIVLQRMSLRQRYYWSPSGGTPVEFGGVSFKENFFLVREGDSVTTDCYIQLVRDSGYTFANEEYLARSLVKAPSESTKVYISYACPLGSLPSQSSDDAAMIEDFMRQQLDGSVSILD